MVVVQASYARLRSGRTWVLLLPVPFLPESGFPFRNVRLIAGRIDKWIRSAALHLFVLGLHSEITAMRAQKEITRQAFEDGEGLHIILCDLRIILVVYQNGTPIHVGAADNHRFQLASTLLHLHRPRGAAFGVTGRQP